MEEKYKKHLFAVMEWLKSAQDTGSDDGISAYFHILKGWQLSYPETTGYIINTFLNYGHYINDESWENRAIKAGEWLLTTQFPDGSFPGGIYTKQEKPRVFNTGMILFGLSELSSVRNDIKFYRAGKLALDWLIQSQDPDGSWKTISIEQEPHAYHSRVGWGMYEMLRTLKPEDRNPKYLDGIMRCAQWTIDHRDDSGWFTNNNLIKGLPPLTHNIAYTLRGLLELGVMLENSTYITAVEQAANILIHDYQLNGYLAAGYGNHWKRGPSFRCITGEAQIGIIWFRLGQVTGNHKFILEANKILNQVLATQWMATPKNKALYGGIPGSAPLWAKYGRLAFPNWAAKFTADLLLYFELYT